MRRRDEEAALGARHPVQGFGFLQDGLREQLLRSGEDGDQERNEVRDEDGNEEREQIGVTATAVIAMGKAKDFKRRADNVLEELFRAMFEEIDTDKIRKEVESLRATAPEYQPAQHARTLARRAALRCAAAGAVTGLPDRKSV